MRILGDLAVVRFFAASPTLEDGRILCFDVPVWGLAVLGNGWGYRGADYDMLVG
jgi:hypothetical protein